MMKILEAEAREMIARERWRANIQHEPFRSTHEGFAVLAEECQELGEAVEAIARELERMWKCIREDDDKAAVAEAAQVGAMAQKFEESAVGAPEATYRVGDRYIRSMGSR